jgi:hypothetical protein
VLPEIAAATNLGIGVFWLLGMSLMWTVLGGMAGLFSSTHAFVNSVPYLLLYFSGPFLLITGSLMFLIGQRHLLSIVFTAVSSVGLSGIVGKTLWDALHPVPLQAPTGYLFYVVFVAALVLTSGATSILLLNYIQIGKRTGNESRRGA